MDAEQAVEALRQAGKLERFEKNGQGPWTVVYSTWRDDSTANGAQFAAFSDLDRRDRALGDASWDIQIGHGLPGFSQSYRDGQTVTNYHRFGLGEGLEPIVVIQEHFGALPEMLPQVTEEFRLFHNLWLDPDGTKLIKLDNDGNDSVAAQISPDRVAIRTNLLKQFQAARQLDLLLFIDSVQFVPTTSKCEEIDFDTISQEFAEPDARISLSAQDSGFGAGLGPFSRLLGTKLLPAPDREHSGVWPFDEGEPEQFPEFIVGEDENGRPLRHSCDPELLGNHFGKNPNEPHYLTPVFFRREVLQKYFEQPEKYAVTDGYLACGNLWGVSVDNDHPEFVVVFLGDLGRKLPSSERDHWKSRNVPPTGGISETSFRRSFLNQPTSAVAPDLQFKDRYQKTRRAWNEKLGWDLFRELVEADTHVLKRLRIPLNESQSEFESQVLNLAKLMIDSLNDAELDRRLPSKIKNERGIAKLRRWLESELYQNVDSDIETLQKLQRLRSRGVAHRKGSDYEEFLSSEIGTDGLMWGFARLLGECTMVLDHLHEFFLRPSVEQSG